MAHDFDSFMERMREVDRQATMDKQLEREGVDKLKYYRTSCRENRELAAKLQTEKDDLQKKHNELVADYSLQKTVIEDLQVEREQLLGRVAELEKGIQEGGDLVE